MEGKSTPGYMQQIMAFFSCSRRRLTAPSSCLSETSSTGVLEAAASNLKSDRLTQEVVCAACSCRLQCSGSSSFPEKDASEIDKAPDAFEQPPGLPRFAPPLEQPPGLPCFAPPPGLPPPPGLEFLMRQHDLLIPGVDFTQQVSGQCFDGIGIAPPTPESYSPANFHKKLVEILRDLASDRNTGKAVQRVRAQQVPVAHHAAEFVDILTRALETKNGMVRRSMIAFCAGLSAGEPSAFERTKCAEGLEAFFKEVYQDLRLEVPKLPSIVTAELLPTLRLVFPAAQLQCCKVRK